MNEDIELIDKMRRLAAMLPREASPKTRDRLTTAVRARQPRTRPPQVVANLPPEPTQAQVVAKQNQAFDTARQNILAPAGATSYEVSHQAIETVAPEVAVRLPIRHSQEDAGARALMGDPAGQAIAGRFKAHVGGLL